MSMQSMQDALNFASTQKQLLKGKAPDLMKEHLNELMLLLEAEAGKDEARAKWIKSMKMRESQKKCGTS